MRVSLPSPTGGLDYTSPLTEMPPRTATRLSNFLPGEGKVMLRKGSEVAARGLGDGVVETLFAYKQGTTEKLYAACGGNLYDVTPPLNSATGLPELVANPAAVHTGASNNRWVGANFGTAAILANGEDTPIEITNAAVVDSTYTATNLNIDHLIYPTPFQNRLFFAEKGTAKIWYSGVREIRGGLNSQDLAWIARRGGEIVALDVITVDSGSGINDLLAVFFDSGVVLIYQGTDPSHPDKWSLKGTFILPPPIGDRPTTQLGGDVVVATESGYIGVLQFVRNDTGGFLTLSQNINEAITDAVSRFKKNLAFDLILYPSRNILIANIPQTTHEYQYVQNIHTKAWSRIDGWGARCFAIFRGQLYFGRKAGEVVRGDVGSVDEQPLEWDAGTPYPSSWAFPSGIAVLSATKWLVVDAGATPTGRIYTTTDAGATWDAGTALPSPIANVRGLAALSATEWFIISGGTRSVHRTTDAGQTWSSGRDRPLGVGNRGLAVLSSTDWYLLATGRVFHATQTRRTIQGQIETAPQSFQSPYMKSAGRARCLVTSEGDLEYALAVVSDFERVENPIDIRRAETVGARWNTARWNTARWAIANVVDKAWLPVTGQGEYLQVRLNVDSDVPAISVLHFDLDLDVSDTF